MITSTLATAHARGGPRVRDKIDPMRWWMILPAALLLSVLAFGQTEPPPPDNGQGQTEGPPRSSDREAGSGESSSRATKIDITPPKGDDKDHPTSSIPALEDPDTGANTDVMEMHPFDPYKAGKDDEVGDFYFRRKNYKAALARYQDALAWKDNDALANFKIAQCQEKLNNPTEAALHYQAYLKILPHGPNAKEAEKALKSLKAKGVDTATPLKGTAQP